LHAPDGGLRRSQASAAGCAAVGRPVTKNGGDRPARSAAACARQSVGAGCHAKRGRCLRAATSPSDAVDERVRRVTRFHCGERAAFCTGREIAAARELATAREIATARELAISCTTREG